MQQNGRLYPLHICRTEPAPWGTAVTQLVGWGDDGRPYVLKRTQDGEHVPASEYICSLLAQYVGLPVPACAIAEMPSRDELVFASQMEGGIEDEQALMRLMHEPEGFAPFSIQITRWHAFDQFARNFDRHVHNYLLQRTTMGHSLLGMDFSHALLATDWPRATPPLQACNTTHARQIMQTSLNVTLCPRESVTLIERLSAVPTVWLDEVLSHVPEQWLDARLRAEITRWWRRGRAKRLDQLRTHLGNGRYLQLLAHTHHPRP